jgi:endo-1,4-beta-mannosidase
MVSSGVIGVLSVSDFLSHFSAMNLDVSWCGNSDANRVALDFHDRDNYVGSDFNRLVNLSSQH